MTKAESIIMSAAMRSKIRTSKELARRSGTPASTMRFKLTHPETIKLSDLAAWQPYCRFTGEEYELLVKNI